MAYQLFQLPRQLNISSNLTLLAAARAYFYIPGTTTPRDTYSDPELATPHTNPVVADAGGNFPAIYLNPLLEYKATLKTSADVELYSTNKASDQFLSASVIGGVLWARTTAEIAASVTPANYGFPPGDIRRYGTNTTPGTTDMTTPIANALLVSASHQLVFQPETYRTGKQTPPAGASIFLPPLCILKDTGALGATERLINITNDDVHIVGWSAKVQMTRADYASGEQRHGVYIFGAQNVTIEGLESSSCGGDGYYLGGSAGDPATNVKLLGVKANDNRRQGCSVVNARHVRIVDGQFTNSNGTAPSAGIDIEPNSATDVLEDIKVIRPRCTGNDGPGIEIFLAAWNSTSNYADIEIIEPYTADNGGVSQSGRLRPGIDINRIGSTTPCSGRIRIVDPTCVDEHNAGIHIYDWDVNGPLVEIIRPVIINPNQDEGATSTIHGGIIFHNTTSHTTVPGNIKVIDPLIRDDDGFLNANSLGVIRVSGKWREVEITNPRYTYAGANPWVIDADARPRFSGDREIFSDHTGNFTISDGRYLGRTITNNGASGGVTVGLPQTTADMIGWKLPFEVFAAQTLEIDPNAADKVVPLASNVAAGTSVKGAVIGSRLELVCKQVGYWHIEKQSGKWGYDPASGALPSYTITNRSTDRAMDCDAAVVTETNDVLGTLIKDLQEQGVVGGTS